MPSLAEFRDWLDGDLFGPDSPGYEAVRRPVDAAYRDVRPRLVVVCRSASGAVRTVTFAAARGDRVTPARRRACSGRCAVRAEASSAW